MYWYWYWYLVSGICAYVEYYVQKTTTTSSLTFFGLGFSFFDFGFDIGFFGFGFGFFGFSSASSASAASASSASDDVDALVSGERVHFANLLVAEWTFRQSVLFSE